MGYIIVKAAGCLGNYPGLGKTWSSAMLGADLVKLRNIYKDMLDKVDLTQGAIEFVRGSDHSQRSFGNFFYNQLFINVDSH